MTISWIPVICTDIIGSFAILLLSFICVHLAWKWKSSKPDDIFRDYIFLLTLSFVFFAVSRSVGHLVKQILLLYGQEAVWDFLSPFSGAVNTAAFVTVFALSMYFRRVRRIHSQLAIYQNDLEDLVYRRTLELEKEIAARKDIEENLRQSTSTLENIFNSANPLCITNLDYDLIMANNAYYQLWPDHAPGSVSKCYQGRPGDTCHTRQCPVQQILEGREEIISHVSKQVQGASTGTDFIQTSRPFRDADGKLVGVVSAFQDISALKATEKALEREKLQLAITLRSIGDAVITTDTHGRIVLLNPVAENLCGLSQLEAAGRYLTDVIKLEDENSEHLVLNPASEILQNGQRTSFRDNLVIRDQQDRKRNIDCMGAPVFDKGRIITGTVLVLRDTTARKRMEQELLKTKKLESVGLLAGGMAHDFNNILTTILGNINLSKILISPDHAIRDLLDNAEKATQRAIGATRQLLTFSKGGEPVKARCSIEPVLREAASFVLNGGNIPCSFDIPADLRDVEIDQGLMSQALQNIFQNSREALESGGEIWVTCRNQYEQHTKRAFLSIEIRDNGIGIPPEIIPNIFDPYFTTNPKNTGLGLTISHSIVTKHGGVISALSDTNGGTTITIKLPVTVAEPVNHAAESAQRSPGGIRKILLMDDEEMVRDITIKILRFLGREVVGVANGEQAVGAYREALEQQEPFDLVIMDLTIPGGKGGVEAVREVLAIDQDARVVVASGYSNDPVMSHFKDYGFTGVLKKPFQLEDIKNILEQLE